MKLSFAKFGIVTLLLLVVACCASVLQGQTAPTKAHFTATVVADHVWRIDDNGSDNIYLVEGKEKALLIDTGLGQADLPKFVATLTKLPVTVVNTHGHPDHAGSNFQFDDVYAHPADTELLQGYDNRAQRVAGLKPTVIHEVKEGYKFELGGRQLEVIEVPGHTPGSIVILDATNKLLFTGDNDNTLVWLFLKHSLPLETYLATLKKINQRNDFETMFPGHGGPLDKAFIADQIAATQSILDSTCTPKPYKSFAGDAVTCEYKRATVAFDPAKLRVRR